MVTTRPPKTIVKPTALGPVANTDTKLLIYGLFQKGRVLAQDGLCDRRARAEALLQTIRYVQLVRWNSYAAARLVIAEQAAQSFTTSRLPVGTADAFVRFEQRVPVVSKNTNALKTRAPRRFRGSGQILPDKYCIIHTDCTFGQGTLVSGHLPNITAQLYGLGFATWAQGE